MGNQSAKDKIIAPRSFSRFCLLKALNLCKLNATIMVKFLNGNISNARIRLNNSLNTFVNLKFINFFFVFGKK